MKKFTLFALATLFAAVSFAQKPAQALRSAVPFSHQQPQGIARTAATKALKAPRRATGLVTPPTDATPETYYTSSGALYVYGSSGWVNNTSQRESVQVIVDGSDIYVAGLAYWAQNAWIKGAISGTTATFASGQQVDDDADYPAWLVGSNDGETVTETIEFNFDQEAGTLTAVTTYICEAASATELRIYDYWYVPVFTKEAPAAPEAVTLPEGVELVEYSLAYTTSAGEEGSGPAAVAVDGDDVYFQGFSSYLPEALIKGKKSGNTVTFPVQYLGTYSGYDSYLYEQAVFTYDPATESYAAEGHVYSVLGDRYYDVNTFNPVLTKVVEKAATPANPSISQIYHGSYGDEVVFTVPTVDVDGNGLVTSKLAFQFYIDINRTVSPLTFEAGELYPYLDEDLTVIPYGFKDDNGAGYDFYDGEIFLNMPHDDWNKIGIKSIYTGGGETRETDIQWYTIKGYQTVVPEDLVTETYVFGGQAAVYNYGDEAEFADYTNLVQVGFDGSDVYIKGLSEDYPEGWVKGTKNADGQYVIPASSYLGTLTYYGYSFPYYFTAVDADGNLTDVVLDYDAATNTLSTSQLLALNDNEETLAYYLLYQDVTISKFQEVAATPADPSVVGFNGTSSYPNVRFDIPTVGTNGEILATDKLSYIIYYVKDGQENVLALTPELYGNDFSEEVMLIPYDHSGYDVEKGGSRVYLNQDPDELHTWTAIGVQSVYSGAGELHLSAIGWFNLAAYWEENGIVTGISTVGSANGEALYFDLQGRTAAKGAKGLLIKQVRDAQGHVKTVKVLR